MYYSLTETVCGVRCGLQILPFWSPLHAPKSAEKNPANQEINIQGAGKSPPFCGAMGDAGSPDFHQYKQLTYRFR